MTTLSRLWAPWRSTFLAQQGKRRCIFCVAKRSRADRQHHVIARGRRVFALLNRYPYNNGHIMIAPYRHVGRLDGLSRPEWNGMFGLVQQLTAQLERTLHPHGFNLGLNVGRIAGAGIPGHLHLHVVPRWNGDTNFMPIVGQTKVISQSLDELYALLIAR